METEDGNEDVCGACTDIGDLICCESCPAAYHAECAGYVSPQEVPSGDWYCWSCCIQLNRSFPFPRTRFRAGTGSLVFVAIEGRLDTFHQATLEQLGADNCVVAYHERQDGTKREQIGRRNHRIWHGTSDPKAWEQGLTPGEWHPLSRRYAVAQNTRAASQSASQPAASAAAPAKDDSAPKAPAAAKRARSRSTSHAPQPGRTSSAPPAAAAPASFMPHLARPAAEPAANAGGNPGVAPRSILVGTTLMGPVMYRPQMPVGPAFPPNASHVSAHFPAPSASVSQPKSKSKKAPLKKRRRSKANSSEEEEESSSASTDSDSDLADSDTQDSGFGSASAAQVRGHKAAKATAGSTEEEEGFLRALTQFWQEQGTTGRKVLAKYQPFESIRLASGMPLFSTYDFWAAVMAIGGHTKAGDKKAWAGVGRLFSPPRSMTTISHTFKSAYEKMLLPFEEATRRGETGVQVPPVTGKLPSVAAIKAKQHAASYGGNLAASSSGRSLLSETASDDSSGSEAPRDKQKYLRVMTQSRGRVRDYGESPVKRARLALEGFTWGRPVIPSAADLAGLDEVMVAAVSVMSQQAADLTPGTLVEYRSREAYLIGGWFRAKILQVAAGSAAEGGRRFLLECLDFDAPIQGQGQGQGNQLEGQGQGQGNLREWVPLIYPDANGSVPHVMIRLPLQPERPPAPEKAWKKGDRVEGFWQNAWWVSTVQEIEDDGAVVCLSDATPVYPEGEEWAVERENLRAGHPQEASGFGMLDLTNASTAVPKSAWREKIKARKFRVDGFTIEAFACQLHLGSVKSSPPEEEDIVVESHAPQPSESPGRGSPGAGPSSPGAGASSPGASPSPRPTSSATQTAPSGSSPSGPGDSGQDHELTNSTHHTAVNQHIAHSFTPVPNPQPTLTTDLGHAQTQPLHKVATGNSNPGQNGIRVEPPPAAVMQNQHALPKPSGASRGVTAFPKLPVQNSDKHSLHEKLSGFPPIKIEPQEVQIQIKQEPQVQLQQQHPRQLPFPQAGQGQGQFQGSWPPQHAKHASSNSNFDILTPVQMPSRDPLPSPYSGGVTFTAQSLAHAQRLSSGLHKFSNADAEAKLFFQQRPPAPTHTDIQAPGWATTVMQNPFLQSNGISYQPPQQPQPQQRRPQLGRRRSQPQQQQPQPQRQLLSLQEQQQLWEGNEAEQYDHDLLQQQHQQQQQQKQQHQQRQQKQQQRAQFAQEQEQKEKQRQERRRQYQERRKHEQQLLQQQQYELSVTPNKGLWIPHLQSYMHVPNLTSDQSNASSDVPASQQARSMTPDVQADSPQSVLEAQHAQQEDSQFELQALTSSHSMQGFTGAQHAQHGAQQNSNHPAQVAASSQSVHSMQSASQGNGFKAFILWVDNEMKQQCQADKRAQLHYFLQKVKGMDVKAPGLLKQLLQLIGNDIVQLWNSQCRQLHNQNGRYPSAAQQQQQQPQQQQGQQQQQGLQQQPQQQQGQQQQQGRQQLQQQYGQQQKLVSLPNQARDSGLPFIVSTPSIYASQALSTRQQQSIWARSVSPSPGPMLPGAHVISGNSPVNCGNASSSMPHNRSQQMSCPPNRWTGDASVMIGSYMQPIDSKGLMQQASDMLTATSHVLQDLSQHLVHKDARQVLSHGACDESLDADRSPGNVEIVDVTESVDGGSPEPDMSLPFPVVTLPFAV